MAKVIAALSVTVWDSRTLETSVHLVPLSPHLPVSGGISKYEIRNALANFAHDGVCQQSGENPDDWTRIYNFAGSLALQPIGAPDAYTGPECLLVGYASADKKTLTVEIVAPLTAGVVDEPV